MQSRIESDLAEVVDGDEYLMICADRKMVFLAGATERKLPLTEIKSIAADGASLVIGTAGGEALVVAFPSAVAGDVADLAVRLDRCVSDWR